MKTKIIALLATIAIGAVVWYLFIKPYDYLVTFTTNTSPGTINQSIKAWRNTLGNSEILGQKELGNLDQKIQFNDSVHLYQWEIAPLGDSTSKVKVYIKDLDHSLKNKLTIPFSETNFEKRTKRTLLDFNALLADHLKKFKVKIVGQDQLKATYCAYVPLKGVQSQKARGMMQTYPLLSSILVENGVELNGSPFVEITKWDMQTDSIHYNFCYPIIKSTTLPSHPDIKYKQLYQKKSLKAIYNGNYITSDRAWYALMDHAKNRGMEVSGLPVEFFYNNPNVGANEEEWKAEVFMPLKDQ